MKDVKSWWESKGIWGAAAAGGATLFGLVTQAQKPAVDALTADANATAEALRAALVAASASDWNALAAAVVALICAAAAVWGRVTATKSIGRKKGR